MNHPADSHPCNLDSGDPCQNDGFPSLAGLVYNDGSWSLTAIMLSRHTGMDCRYPGHREVNLVCPPWPLGSGIPYRNDGFFLKPNGSEVGAKEREKCVPSPTFMSMRIDAPDDELPYGNPRITSLPGMLSVLSWQPCD